MEIIDSQVHINMVGLQAGLVAMDAVGVNTVLIDEYLSPNPEGLPQEGEFFSDTGFRYANPVSEIAAREHPHRFGYITRAQPDDPELESIISGMRRAPGRLALRIIPHLPVRPGARVVHTMNLVESLRYQLRTGAYDNYFTLAQGHRVPVFLQLSGVNLAADIGLYETIARTWPELKLVVDHMGVTLPGTPGEHSARGLAELDDLASLVKYPNVSFKWCHVIRLSADPYPYRDVQDALHRTLDLVGVDRVMWGSDWTLDLPWNTWSEALHTISHDPGLSDGDKEWVLGRTLRSVLDWPNT